MYNASNNFFPARNMLPQKKRRRQIIPELSQDIPNERKELLVKTEETSWMFRKSFVSG